MYTPTTIVIWLLVSAGNGHLGAGGQPSVVLERFHQPQECEATRAQLFAGYPDSKPRLQSVSAKVPAKSSL